MITNHVQDTREPVQIPRELQRSIPRNVVLSRAGRAAAGIAIAMVIAAIAAGVAVYTTTVRGAAQYKSIMSQGAITDGKVMQFGAVGEHGRRAVRYSFNVRDRVYGGSVRLERGDWSKLHIGSAMTIRYLPTDPKRNWMLGHESKGVPRWVAGVAPLPFVFGPVLIVVVLRRECALLAEGRAAIGRVTRIERAQGRYAKPHGIGYGYTPGQRGGYRVFYEFNDLSGAKHTGKANVGGIVPPEGSPIVIVYNPDEPQRSAPYPFRNVRTAAEF